MSTASKKLLGYGSLVAVPCSTQALLVEAFEHNDMALETPISNTNE